MIQRSFSGRRALALVCAVAALLAVLQSHAFAAGKGVPPVPKGLALTDAQAASYLRGDGTLSNDALAKAFLGLPYRVDGAFDEKGNYTLFAERGKRFQEPGLNCSGLVLELSRMLLRRNIPLGAVLKDRLGDSGPGSSHGQDWDFGWDLIMNISEGAPRRFLLPGGRIMEPALATGFTSRGYDIHTPATWKELPSRFTPGHIYLVSINVEGRRKGYGLQHYHVGIVYVASTGEAWFYQTTGSSGGVNRRDLKTSGGQASFRQAFANNAKHKTRKMMAVLEVDLATR